MACRKLSFTWVSWQINAIYEKNISWIAWCTCPNECDGSLLLDKMLRLCLKRSKHLQSMMMIQGLVSWSNECWSVLSYERWRHCSIWVCVQNGSQGTSMPFVRAEGFKESNIWHQIISVARKWNLVGKRQLKTNIMLLLVKWPQKDFHHNLEDLGLGRGRVDIICLLIFLHFQNHHWMTIDNFCKNWF